MTSIQPDKNASHMADEEHAILAAVLDTVVDAIITIDHQGIIQQVNSAACRIFQYSPEEMRGQNISMLMPSPDREHHDGYLANFLRTGQARIIGVGREVQALRKDGSTFVADLAVSMVRVGERCLFTGILRDMTLRIQTEEALHRERKFAKSLLDTSNAMIVLIDDHGRLLHVNLFMEQVSGYCLEELRGQDWFDLFIPPEDRMTAREQFQNLLDHSPRQNFIGRIQLRLGNPLTVAWSARRLLHTDSLLQDGVLAIGTDITQLKRAEEELIQSERLAAIGQMVTGLAHESRNALQRSRACLDMLELDVGRNGEQLELVRRIQQALNEMQRLYEEVRNYAAPLRLDLEPCNLMHLIRNTWELVQDRANSGNVLLVSSSFAESTDCNCDCMRVQQVLRNIFENSLAVAPRFSSVYVTIRASQLKGVPAFELSIRDEGPGLSVEQATRIFDPFYTTSTKGTGLGMAIAKRIVEAHCGEIHTAPSLGQGAEILVTLPQYGRP